MASTETADGRIDAVSVDGERALVLFSAIHSLEARQLVLFSLSDQPLAPIEGMRRGALLSLAQRALTHGHSVRVVIDLNGDVVQGLRIANDTVQLAMHDGTLVTQLAPHEGGGPHIGAP